MEQKKLIKIIVEAVQKATDKSVNGKLLDIRKAIDENSRENADIRKSQLAFHTQFDEHQAKVEPLLEGLAAGKLLGKTGMWIVGAIAGADGVWMAFKHFTSNQ